MLETKQTCLMLNPGKGAILNSGSPGALGREPPWPSAARTVQFYGNDVERWTKWTMDFLLWRSGARGLTAKIYSSGRQQQNDDDLPA